MTTYAAPVDIAVPGSGTRNDLLIESNAPGFAFENTNGGTDGKWYRWIADGEKFKLQLVNDALNSVTDLIVVDRTGSVIDSVAFPQGEVRVNAAAPTGGYALQVGGLFRFRNASNTDQRIDFEVLSAVGHITSYQDGATNDYVPQEIHGSTITHAPGTGAGGFVTSTTGTVVDQKLSCQHFGAWTTFPFATGWANVSVSEEAGGYRKHGDKVQLKGWIGKSTANSLPGTLPAGYRPSASRFLTTIGHDGTNYVAVLVEIDTSGNVNLTPAVKKVSLTGLDFDL